MSPAVIDARFEDELRRALHLAVDLVEAPDAIVRRVLEALRSPRRRDGR